MLLRVVVAVLTFVSCEARAVPRVFVAPFAGATSDPGTVDLIEDRVLVAARASTGFEVIGAADLQNVLDVEAAKQAVGCDSTSCANEIADALAAEQIVFGQLGRIGDTWQLTLTRTERATLKVLGRAVREARGTTPEGLLDAIPGQVGEVFGVVVDEGPGVLAIAGIASTAAGALGVVIGGALWGYSWNEYFAAERNLKADPVTPALVASAQEHRVAGEGALAPAYIIGGVGLGIAVVGAGLWTVSVLGGAE